MSERQHILVCDDERDVADLVAQLFEREGYAVTSFAESAEALDALATGAYDLAVLDIMMPRMDGFELCRRLRALPDARAAETPVIFLSAKTEEFDKVLGFTLGANDYVVKPFKPRELVVRVKARLRDRMRSRSQSGVPANILRTGDIEIDEKAHTAALHGEPLALTPTEFSCLAELLRADGAPVAARALFERVWKAEYNASSHNTVMVYIRRLRKKLAEIDASEEFIETVWGVGYRIASAAEDAATAGDVERAKGEADGAKRTGDAR